MAEKRSLAQPTAWITAGARRSAIDAIRRNQIAQHENQQVSVEQQTTEAPYAEIDSANQSVPESESLRLIFTRCHPLLALEARIGLTLRIVAGLTTPQIDKSFVLPEVILAKLESISLQNKGRS